MSATAGQRYALTLCRDHEYLVGARHPDDGRIQDPWARHEGVGVLPEGYDEPDVMRDDLLRMWSLGKADMHDIMEILRMSRADVMYSAMEAGYGLHLEGDEDDDEKRCSVRSADCEFPDDGTRH